MPDQDVVIKGVSRSGSLEEALPTEQIAILILDEPDRPTWGPALGTTHS